MARNEPELGGCFSRPWLFGSEEDAGTLAEDGDDGSDDDSGQSSSSAPPAVLVDGDVVDGLGGACSGAQVGMIIGRAMREAFLDPEAILLPSVGLAPTASSLADGGGVTPSVGAAAVRFFLDDRDFERDDCCCCRGGGAGLSLP